MTQENPNPLKGVDKVWFICSEDQETKEFLVCGRVIFDFNYTDRNYPSWNLISEAVVNSGCSIINKIFSNIFEFYVEHHECAVCQ